MGTQHCLQRDETHQHHTLNKRPAPAEKWTLVNAPRLEPATVENPAPAKTAPAPLARRVAAHAVHLAAASAPLAACAKGRHVTPAAVSEEPATSASVLVIEAL